jgi:inorganic pyrophosphatase
VATATRSTCIPCDPIGVLLMRDEAGDDPKILAVPHDDPVWTTARELDDVRSDPRRDRTFLRRLQGSRACNTVTVDGSRDRVEAERLVADARAAHAARAAVASAAS